MSNLIILLGSSGSGKSYLKNGLNLLNPKRFKSIVTATTRKPRSGEIDGIHYHFLTSDSFKVALECELFAEYESFGNDKNGDSIYYGTPLSELEGLQDKLLVLEPKGAAALLKFVKEKLPEIKPFVIYLNISLEERRKNMAKRGDSASDIKKRVSCDDIDERFSNSGIKADLVINKLYEDLPKDVYLKLPEVR